MELEKLKDMSQQEREDFFDAHSIKSMTQTYSKPLTEGELRQAQEDFAQLAIEKAREDDEFSKVKEEFKSRIKPLNSKISAKLQAIKNRSVEMSGPVHHIPDYDKHTITVYANDGTFVMSRMMRPEERQMHINHQISKAE